MRSLSLVALAALAVTVSAMRIPIPPHQFEIDAVKPQKVAERAVASSVHKRQCPAKPTTTSTIAPEPTSTEVPEPSSTEAPVPTSTEAPPPPPPSTTDAPSTTDVPSTTDAPPSTTAEPSTTDAPPPPPPSTTDAPTPTSPPAGGDGPTKTQPGAIPSHTKATDDDPYLESLSEPLNYSQAPDFVSEKKTGVMTYYGQGQTACGDVYDDSTYTAAISHTTYDAWPGASQSTNRNPVCGPFVEGRYFLLPSDERVPGKSHATMGGDGLINCQLNEQCHYPLTATITNPANNVSFTVHIVDRCEGCVPDDIDLAPAAFLKLTVPDLDTSNFQLGDYMAEASKNALGRVPVTWKFDTVQKYGAVRGEKENACAQGCAV